MMRERGTEYKKTSDGVLRLKVTTYHFHHVWFIRSTSLGSISLSQEEACTSMWIIWVTLEDCIPQEQLMYCFHSVSRWEVFHA